MPASSKNPSAESYRAGIVGCGRVGCVFDDDPNRPWVSTHAGAYTRTAGVELVALADVDAAKLQQYGDKFNVPGRYDDFDRMLAEAELDILSICTTNESHQAMCEAAVGAGVKAIFCEKPIAESLTAADAMIAKCHDGDVLLMIDHQRRFDHFHQQVAAYLKAGYLGDIQQVTCYYTAGVANTGSHLFDLLRFFFGDIAWVQGRYSRIESSNPNDPDIDAWLVREDGLTIAVQSCDVKSYVIFEVNILGTKGRLRITSSGLDAQFEAVGPSTHFEGYKELHWDDCPVDPGGPREFMLQGVGHLVDCLEHGRTPVSTGEDGRKSLELICALRTSAESDGEKIVLPLADSDVRIQSR